MTATEFDHAAELTELRRVNRQLQRDLLTAKAKTADLVEAVRDGARDAALIVGPPPPIKPVGKAAKKGKPEVAVVHASDWQWGKRTVSFDSAVAHHRVDLLATKVERLTTIQRADHPVIACHLLLGGDMVEGVQIFPGQAWEVDSTLYEQLFSCARGVEHLIRRLCAVFPSVEVWCEPGNHGRLGRKGDYPGQDNADNLLYAIVGERFAGDKRVRWHPPSGNFYQSPEVGSWRPLLVHGDEIKSFGGNTPAFGILRKCQAWASGVIPSFGDVFMGHFHTPMSLVMANGNLIRVNGTLESDNAYAKEFVAATGRPCQRLVFVEPGKGRVTADYLVYLDE
jgi:hypothetical protein